MEIKNEEAHFQDILKNGINIPVYQRDYAQGRSTTQAEEIRKSFVEALYTVARSTTEKLSLDLIFTEADKLVDGQQRLTTLLLFYLYHQAGDICFKNFKYDGRKEVEAFWNNLIDKWSEEIKGNLRDDTSVTNYVIGQMWFHLAWKNDPTIMGMLRTLDEIHTQSKGPKLFPKWELRFTFIQCDEKETTSDKKNALSRYAAMNARGKMLTNFENLKAYLESKKLLTKKGWSDPIDNTWLEQLWRLWKDKKENATCACDSALLRLTLSLLLLHYTKYKQVRQGKTNEQVEKVLTSLHQMSEGETMSYSIVDEVLQGDWHVNLMTWMACLFNDWRVTENRMKFAWGKDSWSPFKELSYKNLALLYAYVCGKDKDDDWFATVHNMIENVDSPITQAAGLLRAIAWIDNALINVDAALEVDATSKDDKNKGFATQQAKEELKKRQCIALPDEGKKWREQIRKAERLPWLKGRIAFLLDETVTTPEKLEANYKAGQKIKKDDGEKWLFHVLWHLAEENEKERNGEDFTPWCELACALEDDQLKAFIYSNERLQKDLLRWTKEEEFHEGSSWERHVKKIKCWRDRTLHHGGYGGGSVWLFKNTNARNALRIDREVDWWFNIVEYLNAEEDSENAATSNWEVQDTSSVPWLQISYKKREFALGSNGTIQIWLQNDTRANGGDWCPNGKKTMRMESGDKELELKSFEAEAVKAAMEVLMERFKS